jgi:hypothetical protein
MFFFKSAMSRELIDFYEKESKPELNAFREAKQSFFGEERF